MVTQSTGSSWDNWRKHPYGSIDQLIICDFFQLVGDIDGSGESSDCVYVDDSDESDDTHGDENDDIGDCGDIGAGFDRLQEKDLYIYTNCCNQIRVKKIQKSVTYIYEGKYLLSDTTFLKRLSDWSLSPLEA